VDRGIKPPAANLGVSYSRLIGAMEKQGIDIDRKILADLAIQPNPKRLQRESRRPAGVLLG